MIAFGIDTLGSLLLALYAWQAAWHLVSSSDQATVWLGIAAGIRLSLTFKVAATLLTLGAQPDLPHLGRVALVVALRLLIRTRTVETARLLASRPLPPG